MLSLINFEIQANLGQYESAMDRAAVVADTSMNRAGAAADRWQSQMDHAAAAAGASADSVAAHFEAADVVISRSADQSAAAVQRVDQRIQNIDMRSWSEKVSGAFGAGFGAGFVVAESWLDKLEQFVKTKLIIAGIAIATGVAAAALTAVYAAYKASEFVVGLFTGESYKSDSIDSLIQTNTEVMKLQDALGMAAPKAQALSEALAGIGMSQTAYADVADKTQNAIRTNTEELDRLGVKYKDANGNLLPLIQTQRNALAVIDSYSAGWDRNQAAAAIGMGTQKDLRDAVSATSEVVDTALNRLIDYNLVIGEGTQAAVSNYERAMRQFNQETDLTTRGFKRAIADNIMPTLADMADFFQEGFPSAVRGFRGAIASITTLMLGLKTTAFIVSEGVLEAFLAIGDVVTRVGTAIGQAMTGHFEMAVKTLMNAPDDLSMRWNALMMNVRAQATRNRAEFDVAWGDDSRSAHSQVAADEEKNRKKKGWVAAPKEPQAPQTVRIEQDPEKALLETQIKTYERAIQEEGQLLSNREAMLKGYFDRGGLSAEEYYSRLDAVRTEALDNARGDYAAEIALINDYASRQVQGSKQAIEAAGKLAEAQDKLAKAGQASAFSGARTWLDQDSRTALAGFNRVMGSMVESASNTGQIVEGALKNAFSSMEDALVSFTRTGKLDFKSMADSIISDIIRIQVRQQMAGLVKMGLSAVGNLFSPAAAATTSGDSLPGFRVPLPSYDVGTDYVPYDMLAQIHRGEEIVPADQNRGWTGGKGAPQSVRVELVNQTSQPSQAVSATPRFDANGMVVSIILRDLKNNGPIRQALGT